MSKLRDGRRLLRQLRLDVVEEVVQPVTQCAEANDDTDADDRCDQAVLNGRGTGLILQKVRRMLS